VTVGNRRASGSQACPVGCTARASGAHGTRQGCLVWARYLPSRVHFSVPPSPHRTLAHRSRSGLPRPTAFTHSQLPLRPSISRCPAIYRGVKNAIRTHPSSVPAPPLLQVFSFDLGLARIASVAEQRRAAQRPAFGAFRGGMLRHRKEMAP
jgi:hypothetical protein